MSSKTRKAILLVVEGLSDKYTWENAIRTTLSLRFPELNTEIYVVRGDATISDRPNHFISSSMVIANVQKTVADHLRKEKGRSGLRVDDILAIAQITDLDACYADPSDYVEDPEAKGVRYDADRHLIYSKSPDSLADLRATKAMNIDRLWRAGDITFGGKRIPYRLFYTNINLEHALYGRPNCTQDEKEDLSLDFDDKYGKDGPAFVARLEEIPSLSRIYKETWNEDSLHGNAFARLTNILSLLAWAEELAKAEAAR